MKTLKHSFLALTICLFSAGGTVPALADLIGVNLDTGTFYNVSTTNAALTPLANPGITNLAEIERANNGTLYGFTTSGAP